MMGHWEAREVKDIVEFYNTGIPYSLEMHMWALHNIEYLNWDFAVCNDGVQEILFLRSAEDAAVARLKFGIKK